MTDKFEYSNGFEGLVLSETSLVHRSTDNWESSTHGDAYVRKGDRWANISDISNHTGIARMPTNKGKIKRTATYDIQP